MQSRRAEVPTSLVVIAVGVVALLAYNLLAGAFGSERPTATPPSQSFSVLGAGPSGNAAISDGADEAGTSAPDEAGTSAPDEGPGPELPGPVAVPSDSAWPNEGRDGFDVPEPAPEPEPVPEPEPAPEPEPEPGASPESED
jgi:hypothetical protein